MGEASHAHQYQCSSLCLPKQRQAVKKAWSMQSVGTASRCICGALSQEQGPGHMESQQPIEMVVAPGTQQMKPQSE